MIPGIGGIAGFVGVLADAGYAGAPFLFDEVYATGSIGGAALTYPAGIQANDVAIICARGHRDLGNFTYSTPAGYTEEINVNGSNSRLAVYSRRLDGSESGSVTVTPSAGGAGQGHAAMLIYRGCKTTGAYTELASGGYRSVGSMSTVGAPIVNVTDPDRTLLSFYLVQGGPATVTPGPGWSQLNHGFDGELRAATHEQQMTVPGYRGEAAELSIATGFWWLNGFIALIPETTVSSSTPVLTDPHIGSTVFLGAFNGVDASADCMDDVAPVARSSSRTGSVDIDTAQFKFGSASLRTPASTGITFPNEAAWQFGAGNFTIDCWVRYNAVSGTLNFYVANFDSGANQRSWGLVRNAGNVELLLSSTGLAGPTSKASAAWTPSAGVWYLVSADFDGTNYRTYVDGVMMGKSGTPMTLHNSTAALSIGAALAIVGGNGAFDGWVDEVRITKGVARYASDSGFAVPTAAFPRT